MFTEQTTVDADPEIAPMTEKTRAEIDRDRYARKKTDGECIKCDQPAAPDSLWCAKHGTEAQVSARAGMKRIAAIRRAAGQCAKCGQPKPHTERGRKRLIPSVPIPAAVPTRWHTEGRRAQVEARTTRSFEKSGDASNWGNRSRYHGRHRGHPSRQEEDSWDLRAADAEFQHAAASLAQFYSADVQALPRIQRDAVLAEAIGHMELAEWFLTELIERLRRRLR